MPLEECQVISFQRAAISLCPSSVFLRRGGTEDNFVKLRGGTGKLSVSHDSVFPGEVPHTRPLSSLANLPTLEVSIYSLIHHATFFEKNSVERPS